MIKVLIYDSVYDMDSTTSKNLSLVCEAFLHYDKSWVIGKLTDS
jgi:hypothetical protein